MNTHETPRNVSIKSALEDARARYVERNPESHARHRRATEVMPGGNTRTVLFHSPFPLAIKGGRGCHVEDADGHDYVDYLGEYTAGLFGHSNPDIRAAIIGALDRGINLSGHNTVEPEFAEAVCARVPSLELVRFTNSGTEANLMAVATACIHTGRRKVLAFRGGYHGGLLSFGETPVATNVPHEFLMATYNDAAGTAALLEEHGDAIAAIIVEPMMGASGCIPADGSFLKLLRDEADRRGIVLIFDEVMTSRLSPGGLQEVHGILPDLTTLGKYMGGGMSFGAFGGRRELMSIYDPRRADSIGHAGTFNNNIMTMSAGLVAMTKLYTPDVARKLNALGDDLRERLNAVCHEHGAALVFTGIGSMMTAHFAATPPRNAGEAQQADQSLKELFYFEMLERGVFMARRAMVALSLEIAPKDCDMLVEAVADFVSLRKPLLSGRVH